MLGCVFDDNGGGVGVGVSVSGAGVTDDGGAVVTIGLTAGAD